MTRLVTIDRQQLQQDPSLLDLAHDAYDRLMVPHLPEEHREPWSEWLAALTRPTVWVDTQEQPAPVGTCRFALDFILVLAVTVPSVRGAKPLPVAVVAVDLFLESRVGLVSYLIVDPDFRRRGLARQLLSEAVRVAAAPRDSPCTSDAPLLWILESDTGGGDGGAETSGPAAKLSSTDRLKVHSKLGFYPLCDEFKYCGPPLSPELRPSFNLHLCVLASSLAEPGAMAVPSSRIAAWIKELWAACYPEWPRDTEVFVKMFEYLDRCPTLPLNRCCPP